MFCRRAAVAAMLSFGALGLSAGSLAAQTYPSRTITIVVGFAPGGFVDAIARLVGQKLSERLGQSVVIENRAGAGGNIAHRFVAAAAPDGHTLLAASTSLAINETLYKNRGYLASDFTALSISASTPEIVAAHVGRPKPLSAFIAAAKGKPITFATAGAGSASYIVTEYFFKVLAKAPATHVPFQGGAPAINAAIGDQVDLVAAAMAGGIVPQVKAGKLQGLAVASDKRVPQLPDVPTYDESGYAGFTASAWAGFFAPAKTPPEVVRRLNAAIDEIMKMPDVLAKLEPLGFAPIYNPQPLAEALFKAEIAKWDKLVTGAGVSIN